ncbi:MAG: hypothetical protein U5L75_00920 [Candidatus Campbellbacteria bacterium]|nr:hypothetical protein [Candidatus Campbellbacteria bacterium]
MLKINDLLLFFGTTFVFAVWVMVGWPQLGQNPSFPPEVKRVQAASAFVQGGGDGHHRNGTVDATFATGATADNVIVVICSSDTSTTFTIPSGFTEIRSDNNTVPSVVSYYTVASGGETTFTCNNNATSATHAMALEYSGLDTSDLVDTTSSATGTGSGVSCPSVNPGTEDHLYITAAHINVDDNFGGSWNNSFTERIDQNTGKGPGRDRVLSGVADLRATGAQSSSATVGSSGDWLCQTIALNEPVATVISVSVSDGAVSYGLVETGTTENTLNLSDTQTITNEGNVNENFEIIGQDTACPWTLATSAGTDQYVHEFSTDSGTNWTYITTSYQQLATNVPASGTQDLDLRITAPSSTSCDSEQNVDVTIRATES